MGMLSLAIIKLTLIALFGFCLYKKTIIKQETLDFLTFFIINFSIPFLIFSNLIENSNTVLDNHLMQFMIASLAIFLVGYFFGTALLFKKGTESKKEFLSLVSLQNAGYLPMNIVLFFFPQNLREQFLVYIFLYLLGFNILMWSIGSFFIFRKEKEKFKIKEFFTPPVTATFIALFFVYTHTARFIPSLVLSPIKMIGQTSFVVSMVVLGCWLAKVKLQGIAKKLFVIGQAAFIRLAVVPFVFLVLIMFFRAYSFFWFFILLEAAMPSAASLPIVVSARGADSEFVSQGVFATHILCIFTVPLWLGIYIKFAGPLF